MPNSESENSSSRSNRDSKKTHHVKASKERPDSECKVKQEDEDIRVYAAMSFAFLLIVVGIPLWWKTTEVYRVHVPYGRIDDLKEIDITFPITVTVVSGKSERTDFILSHLRNTSLSTGNGITSIDCKAEKYLNLDKVLSVSSLQELDALELFPNQAGYIYLFEVPNIHSFTDKDVVVGSKRVIYFSEKANPEVLKTVLDQWMIRAEALFHTKAIIEAPNEYSRDKTGRRRMPPAAKYDIMFSMVHPEPEKRDVKWNIREAIADHMGPLLDFLAPLTTFHIKSQWLYSVRLEGHPHQVEDESRSESESRKWYYLPEDVLPHIITPLEKKLGSGVSEHPTIQLVLYIPPCQISPLYITSSHNISPSTAFLSPRWGGVQIFNTPQNLCGNVGKESYWLDSSAIMTIFKMQLKLLLGIPELEKIEGVEQIPLPKSGIRDWELDSLMRIRATEHLISARITLKSLAQLLDEISNIVINDEVGNRIWESILKSHDSIQQIQERNLTDGYSLSKEAFLAAETAFSDPSLLALLYFPEDQKYAVYIPLFLPVMIPVLMSLKSIRTWWVTGSVNKTEEKDKTE